MQIFLRISFFFLLVTQICFAQWVQIGLGGKSIIDFAARDSNIFAISIHGEVFRSSDNGANWTMVVDSAAQDIAISTSGKVFMIKGDPGEWTDSLYSSSDNGETWTHINLEGQLLDSLQNVSLQNITISPAGIIFCGLHRAGCIGTIDALAKSTDDGLTWTTPGVGVIAGKLFDFSDQNVITIGECHCATTYCHYIYMSSDYGNTWNFLDSPPPCPSALGLFSNENIMIGQDMSWGGTGPYILSISEDDGSNWIQISALNCQSLMSLSWVNGISEGILIGTIDFGVIVYSDEGDSLGLWNEGLYTAGVLALGLDNNGNAYLSELGNIMLWSGGIWRRPLSEIIPVELTSFTVTTNGKEVMLNWSTATELNNRGFEIQRNTEGVEFLTVGFVKGHGTTTELQNYSYADKNLNNGKYYYRLKQVDYDGSYEYSDVVEIQWRAFNSYLLEQNWPNPFNPTTTIGFGIQNKSNVKITVLNVIGEEVAVILNEEKEAGYHQVEFRAANLSSGVYFYQLKAGEYASVKKMILIK